ncbi:predicted protein [Uncinocarpus reesii 1704]|uniref:Protein kinase domain-containing protein n=1 Tax=Uncinocarpus reesii (strain UAMH 1704) TaxID=336963 RepID=C4JZN2_UNCRE|nr:uncharacterized protein UREG_07633 [Uncinocarpus reesii 1704]EEP82768.1 predicted protein [Uncinocarpus reesii 1704]
MLALAYMHSKGYAHGDIHLQNILVKLPSGFDELSIEQLYEKYGRPEKVSITRRDREPLPPNVPPKAVLSLYLGKIANKFNLADVQVLLGDFGEAFAPALSSRAAKDCNIPLAYQPPEVQFEPQTQLTFSADIWSLATAIWEIIGMKAIFSTDWVTEDEMIAQHVDELGPMPRNWWNRWEKRAQFFDEKGCPIPGRQVWPPIDQAFEEWVQKYRRDDGMGEFGKEETAALLALMRGMLAYRLEDRPTVDQVLESEWMVRWVMPDFERSLQARE